MLEFNPDATKEQFFLRNHAKINAMILAANIRDDDRVIEVGAGIGSVARHVPCVRSLDLVELDPRLCAVIRRKFADRGEARVHCTDAIAFLRSHPVDVLLSNLPRVLTHDVLDVLQGKSFRIAVVSVKRGDDLAKWRRSLAISTIEEISGDDFIPPQPFVSAVVRVLPRALSV